MQQAIRPRASHSSHNCYTCRLHCRPVALECIAVKCTDWTDLSRLWLWLVQPPVSRVALLHTRSPESSLTGRWIKEFRSQHARGHSKQVQVLLTPFWWPRHNNNERRGRTREWVGWTSSRDRSKTWSGGIVHHNKETFKAVILFKLCHMFTCTAVYVAFGALLCIQLA